MNKISQIVKNFIQQIIYTNQNVAGIVLTEEYQYVVDEYGIIRFVDWKDFNSYIHLLLLLMKLTQNQILERIALERIAFALNSFNPDELYIGDLVDEITDIMLRHCPEIMNTNSPQ